MKITLWRGYHSPEVRRLLEATWTNKDFDDELLITCPPHLQSADFIRYLPPGKIHLLGDWPTELKSVFTKAIDAPRSRNNNYVSAPNPPKLGTFTSGTISGAPRLVLYSRKNIESSLETIIDLFDRKQIEYCFCYAQPFHTFGLLLGYVLAMYLNCKLITPDGKYDSLSHAKRLELRSPLLLTLGTPTHFYDLLAYAKNSKKISPSYSCIMGGAAVPKKMWQEVRDQLHIAQPSIGYGCTEASPGIAHLPPGMQPREDNEIGLPLPNLKSLPSPDGVEISGPSLCMAFIDEKGLQFPRTLKICDDVRVRSDGIWIYNGRIDLILNRGGEKFSIEKIENLLSQSLDLHAIGTAVYNQRLGQDLGILVRGKASKALIDEIQALLSEQYGLRLNLQLLRFVSELPLTANSKLDRKAVSLLLSKGEP